MPQNQNLVEPPCGRDDGNGGIDENEARIDYGGGRPRLYTEEVRRSVEELWELFGYLCGKRLVTVIRASLRFLDEGESFCRSPRQ